MGRTPGEGNDLLTEADHPHARGENSHGETADIKIDGPSPRAWGERSSFLFGYLNQRTIPTRVGRTYRERYPGMHPTDHPHARGENIIAHHVSVAISGPSPRAWGEPSLLVLAVIRLRTIPTRVGRTSCRLFHQSFAADHPHARGENRFNSEVGRRDRGPSPRAWGEQQEDNYPLQLRRTIPTRVGRTFLSMPGSRSVSDHPHARGENTISQQRTPERGGPSPRAWGELPHMSGNFV